MNSKKVFLGGTCNGSLWRNKLIEKLEIDFFNPVVEDWNEEMFRREIVEKENSDYCLYHITPLASGFYSIAELIDDSNKRPEKTIFSFDKVDNMVTFSEHQIKSLEKIGELVEKNGAKWLKSFDELIAFLNK